MCNAEKKAQKNLRCVAKAVGAKLRRGFATITLNGATFEVGPGEIIRTGKTGKRSRTCYFNDHEDLPIAELIASALLILHRNPRIFNRLVTRRGWNV